MKTFVHVLDETETHTRPAPMLADIAHTRRLLWPVDRHKKAERRRVRRREERAWRAEAAECSW